MNIGHRRLLGALIAWMSAYAAPFQVLGRHRDLLWRLIQRDTVGRTHGTLLGAAWLVAQPALQVLSFWFLLDYVLKVRSPGQVAFLDYFLIAMIPWMLVQETLTRNLNVLTEFSPLYQRTLFPVHVLPWVPLLMSLIVYGPVYAMTSGLMQWGLQPALWALVVMLLLTVWLVPFCYLLAVIGLFFRGFRQVFPFALTMLMYLTPILYAPEALPERIRGLLSWNVLADLVALAEHVIHDLPMQPENWIRPLIVWLVAMPPAWYLFRRAEPFIREEL